MDFITQLIMCLQVMIVLSSMTHGEVAKESRKNKVTLKTHSGRTSEHNKVKKDISGTTESPSDADGCCENGGRCILNSFCHCRKNFYGRYCQFEYKNRTCGPVASGHFIRSDCDLCRCFDGTMFCLPRIYPGCEDEGYVDHNKKIDPFKGKDIEIIPDEIDQKDWNLGKSNMEDDYAYYYDDYDSTQRNSASLNTGRCMLLPVVLLPVVIIIAYVVW